MFCPQCGVESPSGLQYCRNCGANLKVIGKALKLSDAIARSDRGPIPKLKEMVKNLKIDQVTDEVSRALDHMNKEIIAHVPKKPPVTQAGVAGTPWWQRHKKTPQERREEHLTKGTISMFSGVGFTIFLYYFSAALILKLPPDFVARIPFEIDPLVRIIWLLGLIPLLSGFGHIVAGMMIRPSRYERLETLDSAEVKSEISGANKPSLDWAERASVTERTTNLLGVQGSNGTEDR